MKRKLLPRSIGTVEEGSVTTCVTVAEIADSQEQQQQQSKSNGGAVSRRVPGQNVALSNGNSASNVGRVTPRNHMEQEKRMRREIANSNERRRMQSINAGFQSLRTLLPHHEGEKLSKSGVKFAKICSCANKEIGREDKTMCTTSPVQERMCELLQPPQRDTLLS
ncbi:Transcription factor AP-4 [Dufourea novaeangliae]|uniref:Transcription factor AP-4 n=1 Tax=Dufourea novaeangliae TaxID=178035 RepID=A0A154PS00_DUFNO|nr:Transcription factor AP-4 [Dufourea novaeangliae]